MKKKKKRDSYKKGQFSTSTLSNLVLGVFKELAGKKINYKQVSKRLNIKDLGVKMQVVDVMKRLADSGLLKEEARGSFRLFEKTNTITAFIKNTNKKGVYVELTDFEEIFIPKEDSLFALAGDKVDVLVFPKRNKKQTGRVLTVLNRKKDVFVGVVVSSSSNCFLLIDDRRVYFDVFIPPKKIQPKQLGKKVLVQVESWSLKQKNPVGKIISVIGEVNEHNTEINSILYDYGFSSSFPKKVVLAASKIPDHISEIEIKNRRDVRGDPTFTIDPEDAKDFDDALSVKLLENGNFLVGVHIADVSFYVPEGGVIDKEAVKRATSVYLVDRVVPMLPESLSNNLCSLKPNVDRLAYSVFFELTTNAEIIHYKIQKTVIHSDFRFTYRSAQDVIDTSSGPFSKELLFLNRVAEKLRAKRKKEGSINFESREVKFVLDKKNTPIDVSFKSLLSTNHLIEEFMLLANKTVASHVGFNKKTPSIYRVHDKPDKEKIAVLSNIVKGFGHSFNASSKNLSSSLNTLLSAVKGKKEQRLVETLTVRSMAKAVYATNNIGHYGLAFNNYSHFTSPIRRYPDLIIHRILEKKSLKKPPFSVGFLDDLCVHCSEQEKTASRAERDSVKYMQVKFLKNKLGCVFFGVISGVTDWGLYVELVDNLCEGLIKISSLSDDHYIYNEKTHSLDGYRNKTSYQLGQTVKIKVVKADLEKKQLDFVLV